ncbi:MAG TPA: sigma-54 dependent transcriptional regulator, partial [Vicinamibacteria bacterium]|nr:sigma-54 dependent transcriptional regulator [Vicinamibacteria bacterium]
LDTASEILDRLSGRSSHWIEPARAALDLAAGNLAGARAALARASAGSQEGSGMAAETLLARSDLALASGMASEAEECAGEALRLFTVAKDREGASRSRLRRGLALVELGRCQEAIREARRTRAASAPCRSGLLGLALLAEGRALLRLGHPATRLFARAREVAERPFREAAELGLAVAEGGTWTSPEVQRPLAALEAWGDRRLLAYALSDLRALLGRQLSSRVPAPNPVPQRADPKARAVAEAATRLLGPEALGERWRAAMTALHSVLPWWRAVLLGPQDLELRWDLAEPQPLPAGDLARELAEGAAGPTLIALGCGTPFEAHPTAALHGLRSAVVAPAGDYGFVCVDFRDAQPGPEAVALVTEVAGLVGKMSRVDEGPPTAEQPAQAGTPHFPGLVGRSSVMQELFREVARVAGSEAPVHVLGATGTGKEGVAEAIHGASKRRQGPFVAVNASSLTDELFDSQLFGHVKGAFTGAIADREGYVVEAEGGTLFLDEVVDLSLRAQARLLRFLETGEYRRLGESRLRKANVRIVTASNVTLEERVQAGQLRADLLYRLKRLTLSLPPLRARGEDIPLLARHFLSRIATQAGAPNPELSAEVAKALQAYSWPGNVRELASEMERLFLLAAQGPLRRQHLSPEIRDAAVAGPRRRGAVVPLPVLHLKEAVSAFERDHISQVLEWTSGNRAQAACALGLTRQALFGKINRLGIG